MKNYLVSILMLTSVSTFASGLQVEWSLMDFPRATVSCEVVMVDIYSGPQPLDVIVIENGVPKEIASTMTLQSIFFRDKRACQEFLDKNRWIDWTLEGTHHTAEKLVRVKIQDEDLRFYGRESNFRNSNF